MTIQRAYWDGYHACKNGVAMIDCPSEYQGYLRYVWEDGWEKAHATRSW